MLLNEFIYFNNDTPDMTEKDRYDPSHDTSVIRDMDSRVGRLTLKMLNNLRKAGDAREKEQRQELDLVKKMYATPAPEGAPPL